MKSLKVLEASRRRWPIIILFSLSCIHYAFQWCSYISCSTVISEYYGVSENMITWEMSFEMILVIFGHPCPM